MLDECSAVNSLVFIDSSKRKFNSCTGAFVVRPIRDHPRGGQLVELSFSQRTIERLKRRSLDEEQLVGVLGESISLTSG